METGRLKGKKITPCLTNDRILNIYKRRLRNEDVTVHFVTEHRSSLTYDLLVGAGIKLPKVTGEAEKIACVYEFEHGKSTLTDSVLAAAGTKVQEVAGVVQMTDTRADEAERGKSTLTDSVLAAAGTKVQEVAGDVQMTDTRADDAERGITSKSTLTDFVLAAAGTKVQEVAGDVQTTDTRADEAERGITKRLVTMETGRLKGKKITPCLTDDRILNIYKSRLRNEDVTVHFVTEYRSGLSYDILVGAGIKLPKVTGEAEKIACVYEYEHGKSTLTDSVLAAAGTKVQEFAGDVQMTDTRADEAERGQGYHKRGYHKRDFDSNSAKQTR